VDKKGKFYVSIGSLNVKCLLPSTLRLLLYFLYISSHIVYKNWVNLLLGMYRIPALLNVINIPDNCHKSG